MGSKIYNERGEFGAKAHVTDDVPPGAVWIRDGWAGLNHLTSGDPVLTGDAPHVPTWVRQARNVTCAHWVIMGCYVWPGHTSQDRGPMPVAAPQ